MKGVKYILQFETYAGLYPVFHRKSSLLPSRFMAPGPRWFPVVLQDGAGEGQGVSDPRRWEAGGEGGLGGFLAGYLLLWVFHLSVRHGENFLASHVAGR